MADGFYILRKSPRGSNPHLEDHGQPRNRRWNAKRLDDRSVDEFLGVCRGLVGDGTLSEEEILFLQTWLNTRTYLRIVGRIMAVAGSLTTEHTMRNVERSGRGKFNLPEEQCLTLALTCCTRVICGAGRQGGTVAERYQGGVAHRSAEAAASWWHLLSEDAVSEARAAASSGAKRSRSVRAVHAALSSSGGTVAPWQFLLS